MSFECIETCVTQGHMLLFPAQTLGLTNFNALLTVLIENEYQDIMLILCTPTSIHLVISMQSAALMNVMIFGMTNCIDDTEAEDEKIIILK